MPHDERFGHTLTNRTLKNKPLVEAVFELRWKLKELQPGVVVDPHYKLLVGRLYDRVREKYPFHEPLPSASLPDEVAAYVVQHRFRAGENQWPLVQLGPGIVTLNDTSAYTWHRFRQRVARLVDALIGIYPDSDTSLELNALLLRYINAMDFDFAEKNVLDLLRDGMGLRLEMREELFRDTGVDRVPGGLDLRLSFPCTVPKGTMDVRFLKGMVRGREVLRWETAVRLLGDEIPTASQMINEWVDQAHDTSEKWFFGTIEGDLLRRFS